MTPRRVTHTIVALVEDRPGVLNRVVSKVRQRNFNIESLAVGHSEIAGLSRMTFVVDEGTTDVEQVVKQLDKLIDVVHIEDITGHDMVSRELAIIKVRCTATTRPEIVQITEIFRAGIIDMNPDSLIVEATGDQDKLDSLIQLLQEFGIIELSRTGRIAMPRGPVRVGPDEEPQLLLPHLQGGRAPGGLY